MRILHGTFPVSGRAIGCGSGICSPRRFLSATGIVIYLVIAFLSRLLLKHWHESPIEDQEE
jgi:hypothetical protein